MLKIVILSKNSLRLQVRYLKLIKIAETLIGFNCLSNKVRSL